MILTSKLVIGSMGLWVSKYTLFYEGTFLHNLALIDVKRYHQPIDEIQGGSDLEHILTYGQLKLPKSRSAIFTRITIINCIWKIIRSFTLLAFRWLIPESSEGLSWSWSYCICIYNYLCNQCISPLTLQYYVITFEKLVIGSMGLWVSKYTLFYEGTFLHNLALIDVKRYHQPIDQIA
jgi:hypothetical protein